MVELDESALVDLEATVGGLEVLGPLVETFLEELSGLADEAIGAVENREVEVARRVYHTMASNAAMFGVAGLSRAWRAAEHGLDAQEWQMALDCGATLRADVAEVSNAIAGWLATR